MDMLALNLKTRCFSPVSGHNPRLTATWRCSTGIGGRLTGKNRKARSLRLAVVCASGKKKSSDSPFSGDGDPSVPGGDGQEVPKTPHEKSEPYEPKSHHVVSDWRDFRANLVAREQNILFKSEEQHESGPGPTENPALQKGAQLSQEWVHPIPVPENGCLLISTEVIDGDVNFQRTVILLLSVGSQDLTNHGPFGLILNRPLDQKLKDMETMNPALKTNFGNHQLHLGGPLHSSDVSMFLIKTETGIIETARQSGFQQVVPGVHFGDASRVEEAAILVGGGVLSPSDFKFFLGFAGWNFKQLLNEIRLGYWVVAACSSQVIGRAVTSSSDQMWQEVLEMMGGEYADLSREARLDEPKQD
ncbi:UPF0301 protein [Rhynchospora pubera]|uniref:UPF0301 protein n=1 Tax=Rhynchospora pubera TaxID=906938 RepID=A0AAV8CPY6_9POAL|nr:UPF0301 protein [Rhynchospora pubera]KAJ4810370.1 UPF0301 protein [Rhynchospora pubera]